MPTQDSNAHPFNPEYIAYHEAGHALFGWYCGFVTRKVVLSLDGNTGGYTELRKSGQLFIEIKKDTFVDRIANDSERTEIEGLNDFDPTMLLMLGGAAAQIIWDTEHRTNVWANAERDRQFVVASFKLTSDAEWQDLVETAVLMLRTPVVWQRVERVATALLKYHTLGPKRLMRAIRGEG